MPIMNPVTLNRFSFCVKISGDIARNRILLVDALFAQKTFYAIRKTCDDVDITYLRYDMTFDLFRMHYQHDTHTFQHCLCSWSVSEKCFQTYNLSFVQTLCYN